MNGNANHEVVDKGTVKWQLLQLDALALLLVLARLLTMPATTAKGIARSRAGVMTSQ